MTVLTNRNYKNKFHDVQGRNSIEISQTLGIHTYSNLSSPSPSSRPWCSLVCIQSHTPSIFKASLSSERNRKFHPKLSSRPDPLVQLRFSLTHHLSLDRALDIRAFE